MAQTPDYSDMATSSSWPSSLRLSERSSTEAMRPPMSRGLGMRGTNCIIRVNRFLIEVAEHNVFCKYDVAIEPEVTSRAACRSIISLLVSIYMNLLGHITPAYDGKRSLYTAGELPFKYQLFKIKLADNDREFCVTIKCVELVNLHNLQQFLRVRQLDAPQNIIQSLNILMRQLPSQNLVTVARSISLKNFGNEKNTQMQLSLNRDIYADLFYKDVPVMDFATQYLNVRHHSRPLTEKQIICLKEVLKGIRVKVTHREKYVYRSYKIKGLSDEPLSQLTFGDHKRKKRGLEEYFREEYGYRLKNVTWPCLKSGTKINPTYLPMEVCKIVRGQWFSLKQNQKHLMETMKPKPVCPQETGKIMMEYSSNQLTLVEARVLPPPTLMFNETGEEETCIPSVGSWTMMNKKVFDGGKIDRWACISFSQNLTHDEVNGFCKNLFGVCNKLGMFVKHGPVLKTLFESTDDVEGALKKASMLTGDTLELLLIILPDKERDHAYDKIKCVCETELGVVSQCCKPDKTGTSRILQYMESLAMKMNVKVGGCNIALADALPLVIDEPTIIFGADVTHISSGEVSCSIAAVVASMDWPRMTKYKGLVSAQRHRKEIIENLGGMVRELLVSFYEATNRKPLRIIFYRDGVGKGQFNHVLRHEMLPIKRACASLEPNYEPKITFVVVQKRNRARFLEVHKSDQMDKSRNVTPGTVVDQKICHPGEFDFLLCSHADTKGISKPIHYTVLWDENKFSPYRFQILTNNLCYTYALCTHSVSVVPPVFYADRAASRARRYVEVDDGNSDVRLRPIKDNIKEFMFFC